MTDPDRLPRKTLAAWADLVNQVVGPRGARVNQDDQDRLEILKYLAIDLDLADDPRADAVWDAYVRLGGER